MLFLIGTIVLSMLCFCRIWFCIIRKKKSLCLFKFLLLKYLTDNEKTTLKKVVLHSMKMKQLVWQSRYSLWKQGKLRFFRLHLSQKYFIDQGERNRPKELFSLKPNIMQECWHTCISSQCPLLISAVAPNHELTEKSGGWLKSPGGEFWLILPNDFICTSKTWSS